MAIIKIKNQAIDLDAAEIPNLSANKITSDTLADARVPDLNTSKITAGTLSDARLPANALNSNIDLTNLSASNLTSGTVATARLGSGTADATTFLRGDNTFASAGGANTPAFKAKSASAQNVTNNQNNLVVLGTEVFDTDNAFSSNKFTVPSGKGGKYFFSAGIGSNPGIDDNKTFIMKFHKNGSEILDGYTRLRGTSSNVNFSITMTSILDLSASDYIELFFFTNNSDTDLQIGGQAQTFLSGFKLII